MNKSVKNLISLIQLIELEEWRILEKELKAVNADYIGILNELKWYVNSYKKIGTNLESYKDVRKRILTNYFPDTNRQTKKLSETYQKLITVLENFVIREAFTKDDKLKQDTLLKVAIQRRQTDEYVKRIANKKTAWENSNERGIWYYSNMFQLNYLEFFHPFKIKLKKEDITIKAGYKEHQNLVTLNNSLDEFYIVAKLRLICELKFRSFSMNEQYNIANLDTIIGVAHQLQNSNESIAIYLQVYDLLNKKTYDSVIELEELIERAAKVLSEEERESVFLLLSNIIAYKMNRQNSKKEQHILYNFYKLGIDKKYYVPTRQITPSLFLNIIQLGALLDTDGWIDHFFKNHEQSLPISIRENMVALCKAIMIHGSNAPNKWSEISKVLSHIQFKEPVYEIKVRIYFSQTFYEEGVVQGDETVDLDNYLDNFKNYIRRHQIYLGDDLYEFYENFIKYLQQLLKNEPSKELYEEILDKPLVASKHWLLSHAKPKNYTIKIY